MTSYVALLRGINLGRTRRVAMADLRAWLADLGYADVRTHLQSGNAVFTSSKRPGTVVREIEGRLAAETGFTVECVLRTGPELAAVVDADPFGDVVTDPARYFVSFLAAPLRDDEVPDIDPAAYEPELFHVAEREVYLWCPDGMRDSPLMRAFAKVPADGIATVRNWNTVTKLLDLAS